MLRKYQTITLFAYFACMLSLFVACSNEDVPVGDIETVIPGSSVNEKIVGDWKCVESENESLIPVGFLFTVTQGMVAVPDGNSALIHYGVIQSESRKRYSFGDGPIVAVNKLTDDELSLAYTSDTTYNFNFLRPD